jgi:glycosyltransferase involved in cell wall biosynthesis
MTAHDETRLNDVWVVVPAFREAEIIGRTVRDLRSTLPNVVVVDDGSRDSTSTNACRAGAHVVCHPVNLGQGAALQTGIEFALANGASVVATFDADGQHRVADLIKMVDILRRESVDIVIGSRFLGSTQSMPVSRRVLLQAAVAFTNLTTGVRLTDAHNGLRAMSASAARRIQLRQNRMAHASEFVTRIAKCGLTYREVPVTIAYTDYSLAKGQKASGSLHVLAELFIGWLLR